METVEFFLDLLLRVQKLVDGKLKWLRLDFILVEFMSLMEEVG